MIADHAVVSNQTNSQHNVIAAANKLVNGGAKVTILGDSIVATSASITSDGKTGKLVTVFVICCDIGHTVFAVDDRNVTLRCLMWCHSYFLENVSMIIIITDQNT